MRSINSKQDLIEASAVINRPFRDAELQKLSKGNTTFTYAAGHAIIDRLNEALTPFGWSFDCSTVNTLERGEKLHIAVYGELGVHFTYTNTTTGELLPMTITKGQWGSSIAKANDKGTMEYGDDLKSASTDALKKCATLLGIGNYISRKTGMPRDPDCDEIIKELNALRETKGWSGTQMKAVLSGLFHKTVTNLSDLSADQLSIAASNIATMPN